MIALRAGMLLALLAGPALAFQEADWPCEQRRVPRLSIGQMWTGPVPEDPQAWRADPEIAALAPRIAARRMSIEDAAALVRALGPGPQGDRAARIAALYAGVFSVIDAERARIVEAIGAFTRRMAALSDGIEADRSRIEAARAAAAGDAAALERFAAEEQDLLWRIRIFQDRSRSVTYVCETPVILERRAFALARLMAEEMAR